MKKLPSLLVCLLSGCSPSLTGVPPNGYAWMIDRLAARLSLSPPLHDFCVRGERRLSDEDCYRFAAPRRWTGIVFQGGYLPSSFYPGRSGLAPRPSSQERYAMLGLPVRRDCRRAWCVPSTDDVLENDPPAPRAFAVTFIGRRTLTPGRYGHMGAFGHEITVERVLAEKEIALPAR